MNAEQKTHAIIDLMQELNCTENQARNALELAQYNYDLARTIVKEYLSDKKTNYVGGNSGQIVEMPKSEYAEEFEKLMRHSQNNHNNQNNQENTVVVKKTLTVYKNGFLIDDKFTRLTQEERDALMKQISETGEVPSHLFEINPGDLVDVEIALQTDETYREDFPGEGRTIQQTVPKGSGESIDLGGPEVVFKLTVGGKKVHVKMGGCSDFHPLKQHLEGQGLTGQLFCSGVSVAWDENPSKYSRDLLNLQQ
ncbi:hypothetical protein NEHOM01_1323 [Nematocida homosporus]|uniref:uncharacterized protein n=1 Tax=Nematocida homosporus TaxID=1912981 RepID=UPI00221FE061|nr:uncharacterized protein NEHOM01_1323 [Nematocida homosporus]KAI5186158.1 hypothetical protein NEHOM01_1323 [Nematocida homosporus]